MQQHERGPRALVNKVKAKIFEGNTAFLAWFLLSRAEGKTDTLFNFSINPRKETNLTEKFAATLNRHPEVGPKDPKERMEWVADHGDYLRLKITDLFLADEMTDFINRGQQITGRTVTPGQRTLLEEALARQREKRQIPSAMEYTGGGLAAAGETASSTRVFKPEAIAKMAIDLHNAFQDAQGTNSPRRESRKERRTKLDNAIDQAFNRYAAATNGRGRR